MQKKYLSHIKIMLGNVAHHSLMLMKIISGIRAIGIIRAIRIVGKDVPILTAQRVCRR